MGTRKLDKEKYRPQTILWHPSESTQCWSQQPLWRRKCQRKTRALLALKEPEDFCPSDTCCSVQSVEFWMGFILRTQCAHGTAILHNICVKAVKEAKWAAVVDHFVPFRESEDCCNTNLGQEELDATKGAPPSHFLPHLVLPAQLFVCSSSPRLPVLHPSAALESFSSPNVQHIFWGATGCNSCEPWSRLKTAWRKWSVKSLFLIQFKQVQDVWVQCTT